MSKERFGVKLNQNAFNLDEVINAVGVEDETSNKKEESSKDKKDKKSKKESKKDKKSKKEDKKDKKSKNKKGDKKKDKKNKGGKKEKASKEAKSDKAVPAVVAPDLSTENINRKVLAFVKNEKSIVKEGKEKRRFKTPKDKKKEKKEKDKKKDKDKGKKDKKADKPSKKSIKKSEAARDREERLIGKVDDNFQKQAIGKFKIGLPDVSAAEFAKLQTTADDMKKFRLRGIDD